MQEKDTTPERAAVVMSDEEFAALYPTMRNDELATRLGRSIPYVEKRAHALGLYKTKEHWSQVHLGQQNSLGHRDSDTTREKKSRAHKGVPLSPDHRQAISQALTGIDRGGKKAPPYARMSDPRYRAWRKAVLQRDDYHCQEPGCTRQNRTGRGMHAHHILPWHEFEDLRHDISNGVTLCTQHHRGREGRYVGKEFEMPDMIPCACGCGTMIPEFDDWGRPRRFAKRHVRRGAVLTQQTKDKISAALKGRPLPPSLAQRISTRNQTLEQREAVARAARRASKEITDEEFIAAYQGRTQADLALLFGLSQPTINRWAKRLGLLPAEAK